MARYKVKGKDCQLKVKVKLSFKEEIDERQLDFFSSKYIRGLLKVQAKKKNCIEFYGPIGISLFDRLKKPISKYDFFFIMEQVIDITQKANLNSLILRNIVWDIHYVFINETTKELQFIYLPLTNDKKEADVLGFMEPIIYASKTMEEADTEYISRYVYFLKSLTSYDAEKIEKYIFSEDRSVVNTIKRHNVGQSGFITYTTYKTINKIKKYSGLTGKYYKKATQIEKIFTPDSSGYDKFKNTMKYIGGTDFNISSPVGDFDDTVLEIIDTVIDIAS